MSRLVPTTVTRELTAQLVIPEDDSIACPVVLLYDTADPYAVRATFGTGVGAGVCWVFARELLTVGVHRPAGDGDVRVWPSHASDSEIVFIGLASPNGEAVLQASITELVNFLRRSYSLCPQGKEGEHLDVDSAIDALLAY